ncbi:MAG: alpha-keto acid decarboxylase family protein [Desulforhopalus sp.]
MKMQLAHYLFTRLQQCGAAYSFGIPGDFALPLYSAQAESEMKTIVCAHEPGCVYAADAYSRIKGLGVVLTTYGVGGLNMVNPVAMAYAEHSPVVIISGAPAVAGRHENPAFHHLVKDYNSQRRVFAEVTCATTVLSEPDIAALEIDRVLDDCLTLKRPVYIEIPVDMTREDIVVPETPLRCSTGPVVNSEAMVEAGAEIVAAFNRAKCPILYTGVGLRRYRLVDAALQMVETWGVPVVSSVMGKASFPETHLSYVGMYMGKMGDAQARKFLEGSDLVLAVGVIFSDVNSGLWTGEIDRHKIVDMRDLDVKISHHTYRQVPVCKLLPYLASLAVNRKSLPQIDRCRKPQNQTQQSDKLSTAELIKVLRRLDKSRMSFLADVGDGWFAGLELEADVFMAPGYYASMGFAVPGAVGAALAAPERRPVVLVGDGAFQMTGNELSTLIANKLNPLVVVLNNGYYKMLSALDGHRDYYNLHNWDYVQYAEALGCPGARVRTRRELERTLDLALESDNGFLIEAVLQKEDHAPIMQRISDYAMSGGKIR